mgnify:CR=1 FL=1
MVTQRLTDPCQQVGHALASAEAVIREHYALAKAKDELRANLRSILYSCATDKRLREVWPEGMQFMPPAMWAARAVVPVTLVAKVNDTLGLSNRKARVAA